MAADGRRYHWRATYNDGTVIKQVEDDGTKNAYEDIDRDKLARFELWDTRSGHRALFLAFKPGQKLIWRRRMEMAPGGVEECCHIVGKQEKVNGKNYHGIIGLFESDGRIEAVRNFEENHPWFYPPQYKEWEHFDE